MLRALGRRRIMESASPQRAVSMAGIADAAWRAFSRTSPEPHRYPFPRPNLAICPDCVPTYSTQRTRARRPHYSEPPAHVLRSPEATLASRSPCTTTMESTDENGIHDAADTPKPRQLPDDLPRSLDDRRNVPQIAGETEIYDAWQGACPADPASSQEPCVSPAVAACCLPSTAVYSPACVLTMCPNRRPVPVHIHTAAVQAPQLQPLSGRPDQRQPLAPGQRRPPHRDARAPVAPQARQHERGPGGCHYQGREAVGR